MLGAAPAPGCNRVCIRAVIGPFIDPQWCSPRGVGAERWCPRHPSLEDQTCGPGADGRRGAANVGGAAGAAGGYDWGLEPGEHGAAKRRAVQRSADDPGHGASESHRARCCPLQGPPATKPTSAPTLPPPRHPTRVIFLVPGTHPRRWVRRPARCMTCRQP